MFREKLERVIHRAEPGMFNDLFQPVSGDPGSKRIADAAHEDFRGFPSVPGLHEPPRIISGIESPGKDFGESLSQFFSITIPAVM